MLRQTMGIYNVVWFAMAWVAVWLLYRIFEILKALHAIELSRFKRERPEVFED